MVGTTSGEQSLMHRLIPLGLALIALVMEACASRVSEQLIQQFQDTAAEITASSEHSGTIAWTGLDGWLFFTPELRHLSIGEFWGPRAGQVSRARPGSEPDPLPAILDFQSQLEAVGVELLMVPVPPKAVIYPEKITDAMDIPIPVPRLDNNHQAFYAILREQGVTVLDLTDEFIQERFHPEGTLYCRQDTHWSGVGCMLAGQRIASAVRTREWYKTQGKINYTPHWYTASIHGDLYREIEPTEIPREELRLRGVVTTEEGRSQPIVPDPNSPVILLGDSHNLVFHAGDDMHTTGAGLADQLAFELGFPVDLVAVRGSGATPSRVNLLRRAQRDPSYWEQKRLVVWCFTARELTESDGWDLVPIR